MPITIPDPVQVQPIHDIIANVPAVAKIDFNAPSPVSVSASGGSTIGSGLPALEKTVAANRDAYVGFAFIPTSAGQGLGAVSGTFITGFAGVVKSQLVYIADDGSLTQTLPAGQDRHDAIGLGTATDTIYLFVARR